MSDSNYVSELFIQASYAMGRVIMPYANKEKPLNVRVKEDGTKVTDADIAAQDKAMEFFSEHLPDTYVISEENPSSWSPESYKQRQGKNVILLDPFDGSRNVEKNNDFCTMMAYIENGKPTVGVLYHPPTGIFYYGIEEGAFMLEKSEGRRLERDPISLHLSVARFAHSSGQMREKYAKLFKALGATDNLVVSGSGGLRVINVIVDEADALIAYTTKFKEWDTAAAHAIAQAAGVMVTDIFGNPLTYNKENTVHPNGVLVAPPGLHKNLVRELTEYNKTVPM